MALQAIRENEEAGISGSKLVLLHSMAFVRGR